MAHVVYGNHPAIVQTALGDLPARFGHIDRRVYGQWHDATMLCDLQAGLAELSSSMIDNGVRFSMLARA